MAAPFVWRRAWGACVAILIAAVSLCASAPAFAAAQSRWFTTSDGVKLHYLEAGPADAQTLVFVPGWTMPAWIWDRQIEAFSATRHVIAFDPRGQGESDAPALGYDATRRGRDLGELIAHLDGKPVVIVAWSLGVLDTLAYVADSGDAKVSALVLVDNSVGEEPAPKVAPAPAHRSKVVAPPSHGEAMRRFVSGLFATAQNPDYLNRLTEATLHTPEAAAKALRAYSPPRTYWRDALYSTNKPVLYIVRPRWKAQADNVAAHRPGFETAVFEHAGHALFVDQPDRFDALVADFLQRRVKP
ncbi:MAG: alpha/beta hydrolase [Proteobacteria bacterium]|nr:alpha/beta hydrolase [Pseudomonadota bacterium]